MDDSRQTRIEKILAIYADHPALWVALRAVCDNPYRVLHVETPFVGVGEVKAMEASQLGVSALEPGALAYTDRMRHFVSHGVKWRFLRVFDRRVVSRDDNDANRFAAYFVRYSLKLLKEVFYSTCHDEELSEYMIEVQRIIRRLRVIWDGLSPTFKFAELRVLPLDNQLLQFHPQYHVILETYLACEAL